MTCFGAYCYIGKGVVNTACVATKMFTGSKMRKIVTLLFLGVTQG